ncbi:MULTISPECIES: aminotransferase class V-fold PLP-dependent enzyme [unclassified Apibacter]|uniref:aminotransferase class V-fold PLP-dependent enzyme n=1 Tax=unclassified Apibacter TaxID=2630820 RepID=UPI0013292F6F|nr:MULTISPECIES: cysteine desulfurase [unclassified Apibacter]MCX8676359.1 cysteine desulfurase [Apibacter sp. B3919]MXO23823.1 SufS family cysteine desulfurase [Apibacter sp. B3924]MXO26499.1 SufS family cysteine desulfurase [Apibacter sp. B3813]MXO28451.1 SufS family cysteine desulfurase [Apibacter sp. B3913]MXO30405.1 SufS family cysteine desulfurase [Apibacter sp. B3912]
MNEDLKDIKNIFPILNQLVNGKPLVYLDNAATTQKPISVIEAEEKYYKTINSNVHRGIHTLSQLATVEMEESRKSVQQFLNAKKDYEIIFTKGTTDSINLVATGIEPLLNEGDEIIISNLEHHSNIVPWQLLAERKNLKIKVIPVDDNGDLMMDEYDRLLSEKTKIVAVNHISNALGVVNPIEEIISKAHKIGSYVLIDGAQAVSHRKVDVQNLDADFYVFSSHKLYGPTGVGILYGKENILESMKPYQGGGEMIKEVTFEKTTYADLPFKFEAGTPNISGNIVLKNAIDFVQTIGFKNISKHEDEIMKYAKNKLSQLDNIIIYAQNAKHTSGALSFNLDIENIHSSDVGFILDKQGIAVRTGHHCAQPIMQRLGIKGTVRASFAIYTTKEDIDQLIVGMNLAQKMLR